MSLVKEIWDQYEKEVLPSGAGNVQRLETKRAFYAGAASMFNLLCKIDEYSDCTMNSMQGIRAVLTEIEDFVKSVKGGIN